LIEQRVQSICGKEGVIDVDAHGCVEVAPHSEEECALLLSAAYDEGWSVRLCGKGGWIPLDAPAQLVLSTRRLSGVSDLNPADMVMTARVGSPIDELQTAAAKEGTWIALDPPGASRSLGSILATGTSGPLATGFGAVRGRILGLTFVAADGRIVRVGGRVVKNVAGFDLKSLLVGSFGAFGLITSAHVRLTAMPAADVTLIAQGERENLLHGARAIMSSGTTPAAMELITPDTHDLNAWTLSIRVVGSTASAAADRRNISAAASNIEFDALDGDAGKQYWASISAAITGYPITVRMGSKQTDLEQALDLLNDTLDEDEGAMASVSVLNGVTRWSCETSVAKLLNLRSLAAKQDWPVTLERAPWDVRSSVGHYGAYRDGVGKLVASLRGVFDDRDLLVVPLGDQE
jgi:glycolate oxidase FAD binding subunit